MKKFKDEKCNKCNKSSDYLYSNNRTEDFLCAKCYDKLYKPSTAEWNIPDNWDPNVNFALIILAELERKRSQKC